MNFIPVCTKADLDTLDEDEILAGYREAWGDPDMPEPGPNRGRAFWHGWRNAMIDKGRLPHDRASEQLVREIIAAGSVSWLPR